MYTSLIVLLVAFLAFAAGFAFARWPSFPREASSIAAAFVRRVLSALRDIVRRLRHDGLFALLRDAKAALDRRSPNRKRASLPPASSVPPARPLVLAPIALVPPPLPSPPAPGQSGFVTLASEHRCESPAQPESSEEEEGGDDIMHVDPDAIAPPVSVRFDPIAPRGTDSADFDLHTEEWKAAMASVGQRLVDANVCAIVFVHGTFTGSDPLSAYSVVERALPDSIGPYLAKVLRQKTRGYIGRVLGDLGNFGTAYVRLFEKAIRPLGVRIPCTEFVWSSENHHVGRLEGALGLIRVLATHAEIGIGESRRNSRLLVIGHSHAGQLFALITQLLARSIATEAILDVARARGLDVAALETDINTLVGRPNDFVGRGGKVGVDFVTLGAPNRYAWAKVPNVRALHVIAVPSSRGGMEGDWVRRLAVEGSDFPALSGEDRRLNAALARTLGHAGFAPTRVASALRSSAELPPNGDVAFVEYGEKGLLSTGLGHGVYTRLDGMLFHARLVADRLYSEAPASEAASSFSTRAWSALRALGSGSKTGGSLV